VSEEKLVEAYNAADALLFPSFYEGFGWPVLEAMACGTPVVSSDTPALVELVGEAGLVAPPRDVAGLASALEHVLTSPDASGRLREAGLARAEGYGWGRIVAAYASLYREVASAAESAELAPTAS
jgi:glycosyltransferase involved in cell wall biosynthesis